jgi:hypothetical protein
MGTVTSRYLRDLKLKSESIRENKHIKGGMSSLKREIAGISVRNDEVRSMTVSHPSDHM